MHANTDTDVLVPVASYRLHATYGSRKSCGDAEIVQLCGAGRLNACEANERVRGRSGDEQD